MADLFEQLSNNECFFLLFLLGYASHLIISAEVKDKKHGQEATHGPAVHDNLIDHLNSSGIMSKTHPMPVNTAAHVEEQNSRNLAYCRLFKLFNATANCQLTNEVPTTTHKTLTKT